jgi:RimJ/RimL family protein N-acetyltransferase
MADYEELYRLRNEPSMRRFFEDPSCQWRDDPRYWASASPVDDIPLSPGGGPRPETAAHLKADYATRTAVLSSLELNHYTFEVYRTGLWGLRAKGADRLIGVAGLVVCRDHLDQDLVIGLSPAWWGQGLATEAGRALMYLAFTRLDFWEIRASFAPAHRAAIRLAEKLGLQFDTARQKERFGEYWSREEGFDADYLGKPFLFYQLSRRRYFEWLASISKS